MKKALSVFLFCSLSFKLFSNYYSQSKDVAIEALSEFACLACKAEKESKKIERSLAHQSRTFYQNKQYAKRLTQKRHKAADDKAFRQGDFPAGHPLEVAYLQRVRQNNKK